MFGFGDDGKIIWEKTIPLGWKNHITKSPKAYSEYPNHYKLLTINKEDNKISCHFSYNGKITYFEIANGEIINKKETDYKKKPETKEEIREQYKQSKHWYGNYYFSYHYLPSKGREKGNWISLDKIKVK